MKKTTILVAAAMLATSSLSACYDLDREPEGVLSTAHPFTSTGEMQNYLNQFYQNSSGGLRQQGFDAGGGQYIAGLDTHSDNMASTSVWSRMDGTLSIAGASALSQYTQIRNVNFFLNNLDNFKDVNSTDYKQAMGEGYYFRAWFYYQLFQQYGPLAWVDKPLEADMAEMKLPRENRTVIADHILADLDLAIANLKEVSNSGGFRVHRDVARALKSEVALYEATWEKYHKAKNDKFFDPTVTDDKIAGYLNQAVAAAKEVMGRGVWRIYNTGNVNNDYRVIFQTTDLSGNPEVLWFKKYDGSEIGNNVNRYLNQGGGSVGLTASLVDDYLTIDGRPFTGAEKLEAKKTFGKELLPSVRDPRLAQTVATPGQVLRPDEPEGYSLPPFIGTSAYNSNCSGYSLLKHVQIDYTGSLDAEFHGATPAIQVRYADVLLNCAEALAELGGAANSAEIIATLSPLRQRAGMPDVDFDREYNTDPSYPFAGLDKYVQAVRRERRVEQACEGRRWDDIMRWAAADVLIAGQWPQGVLFTGSDLETAPEYDGLKYDQASGNQIYLTGAPGDPYRYVIATNPTGHEKGFGFNVGRDYLLPIQDRMLTLTDGLWTQNPGW